MLIEQNAKVVMTGDSITDCYRGKPVGEGLQGYGDGYVKLVDGLLKAFCPQQRIRVVNMGTGGDTIRLMAARWQKELLDLQPDWVSVMIGVNDVWRQMDFPLVTDNHVYIDEFRQTYRSLIEQTLPRVKGMILMPAFILELNQQDPFRQMLLPYQETARQLAQEYNLVFADVQAAFDVYMREVSPWSISITGDRIHPTTCGHFIIAKAFLDAIGAPILHKIDE